MNTSSIRLLPLRFGIAALMVSLCSAAAQAQNTALAQQEKQWQSCEAAHYTGPRGMATDGNGVIDLAAGSANTDYFHQAA